MMPPIRLTAITGAALVAIGSTAGAQVSVAIEPRVGVSIPSDSLGASPSAGIELDVINPRGISYGLDVSVASPVRRGQATSDALPAPQSYELRQTELIVGYLAGYRRSLDDSTQVRVGAGPLVRKLWVDETTAPRSMFQSSNTQLGIEGAIAIERRLGLGSIVLDVRLVGAWTPSVCENLEAGCQRIPATQLTGVDHRSLLAELAVGYEVELGGSPQARRRRQSQPREEPTSPLPHEPAARYSETLYEQGVAAAARDDCAVARAVAQELRELDAATYRAYIHDNGVAQCLP